MKGILAFCVCIFMISAYSVSAQEKTLTETLKRYDNDGDGFLDKQELIAFFLQTDPIIEQLRKENRTEQALLKIAEDRADDALSEFPGTPSKLSLTNAEIYVLRLAQLQAKPKIFSLAIPGLRISRKLVDAADPRQESEIKPFVLGYTHDKDSANNPDGLLALGSISYAHLFQLGSAANLLQISTGINLDVDSSKQTEKSNIDAAVKFQYERTNNKDAIIESFAVSISPKYLTDRSFDREAYELTLAVSVSSLPLLRAGYYSWLIGPDQPLHPDDAALKFYWLPELRFELGDVEDAAGNARLAEIEDDGVYFRLAPHVNAALRFPAFLPDFAITSDYYFRFDLIDSRGRGYWEGGAQYDLAKNVAVTLLYRTGRRPPDFDSIDAVLVGLGITLQ